MPRRRLSRRAACLSRIQSTAGSRRLVATTPFISRLSDAVAPRWRAIVKAGLRAAARLKSSAITSGSPLPARGFVGA
jgi:hypothetical protein